MPNSTFLIGGGWSEPHRASIYGPFLSAGPIAPTIACVVLDEGDGADQFRRWAAALTATGACSPEPVLVPVGGRLGIGELADADAVLVCGGLTPAYADALAPEAEAVRQWLSAGRAYAGFSAGAAVAAARAVVGGWKCQGRPVCPEDAGEDLDEVTTADGLALVPFAVDVHTAQWGTLPRLVAAVRSGLVPAGVALDEDTLLIDGSRVAGAGHAWCVLPLGDDGVEVIPVPAGGSLPDPIRGPSS